jgi:hypothetical protein
LTSRYS